MKLVVELKQWLGTDLFHSFHPFVAMENSLIDSVTKRRNTIKIPDPNSWTINAKLGCNCSDCAALQTFLLKPTERVCHFTVRIFCENFI